jgi:AbrB family looped-hinge helix DNA binding protein
MKGEGIPLVGTQWYGVAMSGIYNVVVGDRGRLVVPVEVRERAGLGAGTPLVLLDTAAGIVLLTRDQLRARVRDELAGTHLVAELLAERRAASAAEDEA